MTTAPPNLYRDVVVVWPLQHVRSAENTEHSDTLRKASSEAEMAMKRLAPSVGWATLTRPSKPTEVDLESLRRYAASVGVHLDSLVTSAARHFTSDTITGRAGSLSAAELEFFTDDDGSAADQSLP
jgi:hypothetical protein